MRHRCAPCQEHTCVLINTGIYQHGAVVAHMLPGVCLPENILRAILVQPPPGVQPCHCAAVNLLRKEVLAAFEDWTYDEQTPLPSIKYQYPRSSAYLSSRQSSAVGVEYAFLPVRESSAIHTQFSLWRTSRPSDTGASSV